MKIGPYLRNRIVLCSLDATPRAQKTDYCEAGYFFPGGKWVGTMRNAARRLGCRFVILTGKYGMVNPDDVIGPFDVPSIDENVKQIWEQTIPKLIGNSQYNAILIYFGANPRDNIIETILPILGSLNIRLITFGKPNMCDVGKIDEVVKLLLRGTSYKELRAILRFPDRLLVLPGE